MCHVPSRGILEWALLLPLAVPTYIIGYTYTDLLQYAGPVQTTLREVMGWSRGGLLVPADPIARRRDHGHDPGALPLRLPAGARRVPRAVHLHDRRQPHARARPLGQLHRRRRAARPAGDRRRRGAGADGGPGRFRHRAVLRRQHLHDRDLPHLVLARRAGRGGAAGGRPDDGRLPGPGARAALARPRPLPAHGALAPAPLLPAEPRPRGAGADRLPGADRARLRRAGGGPPAHDPGAGRRPARGRCSSSSPSTASRSPRSPRR